MTDLDPRYEGDPIYKKIAERLHRARYALKVLIASCADQHAIPCAVLIGPGSLLAELAGELDEIMKLIGHPRS